jgi:hypothetical protein
MFTCRDFFSLSVLLLFVAGCGDSPPGEKSGGPGTVEQEGDASLTQSAGRRLAGTYISDSAATMAFLESTERFDAAHFDLAHFQNFNAD